jgi:5'-3' exonuclease
VHHGKVLRTEEPLLSCVGHGEADTKIVFHACKLVSDAHLTIRCSDTDILVIMLGNMNFIPNDLKISMHVGTGNHQRFIDINKLYETLGLHLCSSLPGFHALTGCDFNPALYRKGKKNRSRIFGIFKRIRKH